MGNMPRLTDMVNIKFLLCQVRMKSPITLKWE